MTTADAVRAVGTALPRTREVLVRDRRKFRIGSIVYLAFSRDETAIGFGFPKTERDALVAGEPDVFFLPCPSVLRFQWVCAHLAPLADDLMRELVFDAWRMCVPRMLHELPEQPAPTSAAWAAMDAGDPVALRPLLHPYLHFADRGVTLRGRDTVLAYLAAHPTPRPPAEVRIRDGRIYRWTSGRVRRGSR